MSTHRSLASLVTASLAPLALISAQPVSGRIERAVANDNATPAGTMVGDTLTLRLTVAPVAWRILGDSDPAFTLLAFAEEGKAPTIPGPLIRVRLDRIFVITELADRGEGPDAAPTTDRHGTNTRQFSAINGKAWPHTERLRYALGDSVRWRIVNASQEAHPMHLHGFYFRVDSRGVQKRRPTRFTHPSSVAWRSPKP